MTALAAQVSDLAAQTDPKTPDSKPGRRYRPGSGIAPSSPWDRRRRGGESTPATPPLTLPLTDLGFGVKEPKGCRWIDGDVSSGDWRYCQHPQAAGSAYCSHHLPRTRSGLKISARDLERLGKVWK